VFNSFARGNWEKEERVKNPLKKGEDFDFRIRVHDNRFQVRRSRMFAQSNLKKFRFMLKEKNFMTMIFACLCQVLPIFLLMVMFSCMMFNGEENIM
jgi:hypothetical protein